jgi:putative ABC transport system ATP-binding protein
MIELRNVIKVFSQGRSQIRALDGVSLTVPRGRFVSVMGPSGSGKSTLLHLVGGLDAPTGGDISIDGKALSRMTDDEITVFRRRRIGFVFQFFHLLPTLSVQENVALPLLLDGRRLREVRPRVEELLAAVGLSHRRTHRPEELSGGEMQRAAVARALVGEPVLLLADEPTGNLDSRTGEEVLGLIAGLVKNHGLTTVMVTHDLKAAAYGDDVVTLRDGRIVDEAQAPRGWRGAGAC